MEIHELINKYEKRLQKENPARIEQLYFEFRRDLMELEQTKVEIPKFVAEWIEQCKAKEKSLLKSLLYTPEKVNSWVDNSENQETFALAWIFGYEVEKGKRYYIRLKSVDENYNYLTYIKHLNAWALTEIKRDKKFRTEHTREELEEADFGEVFNSPLFEVVEVE
jgi:hypothetical protein